MSIKNRGMTECTVKFICGSFIDHEVFFKRETCLLKENKLLYFEGMQSCETIKFWKFKNFNLFIGKLKKLKIKKL